MKIAEVCERTGLTKRTVRFYIEKGLISPETESRNGRELREFSEEDIKLLKAVSALRRLNISVEDIGLLIDGGVKADELIRKYRSDSRSELLKNEQIYDLLSSLDADSGDDIYSIAAKAEKISEGQKLPERDIEPDFSCLEELTEEEKRLSFERFHTELVKNNAVLDYKHKILKRVLLVLGASVLLFLIVCGISWIPESIEFKVSGTTYLGSPEDDPEKYEDVLTVNGKVFKPLFFRDYFVGEIKLENTPEMCFETEKYISPEWNDYTGISKIYCALFYENSEGDSELELRLPDRSPIDYNITLSAASDRSNVTYTCDELTEGSKIYKCKYRFEKSDG